MIIQGTLLSGAYIIKPNFKKDDRGYFARAYCLEEFTREGIRCNFVQDNISYNKKINTIRGMHYQMSPYEEDKLIRCISGKIFDVVVDMRENSPTYLKWQGFELTSENGYSLFIPKGFAHGYQTLCDDVSVHYKVSQFYSPEHSCGVRFNDPTIGIQWVGIEAPLVLSDQDTKWEFIQKRNKEKEVIKF